MTARPQDHINTYSRPTDLKITDLRTATVGWDHWRFPLIRIDTNQGLSGYGEVRDGASKTYALMLKNRLLGENPCNVDKVFRKIKQFGHHARQGGGVCGIEMALMDLAGKAYGVPAYMLCGGKFRDEIRIYCDTPNEQTGEEMGHKLQARVARGFTMLKMDMGIETLVGVKDALTYPSGMLKSRFMLARGLVASGVGAQPATSGAADNAPSPSKASRRLRGCLSASICAGFNLLSINRSPCWTVHGYYTT